MQRHQSSTSHNGLHSQNSALSWSQRQQLRRTSAAMRYASASRQLPHQDNRVPPGQSLASLLALVNSNNNDVSDDNNNNNDNNSNSNSTNYSNSNSNSTW